MNMNFRRALYYWSIICLISKNGLSFTTLDTLDGNVDVQSVSQGLLSSEENLSQYPRKIRKYGSQEVIFLGDLHGNTLKLVFFLIKEGLFEFGKSTNSPEVVDIKETHWNRQMKEYSKFYHFYNLLKKSNYYMYSDTQRLDTLKKLVCIIQSARISETGPRIIFLGDLLADRGNNDYLTLMVIKLLYNANINYEILLSNHDLEFIRYFKSEIEPSPKAGIYFPFIGEEQIASLQGLIDLIESPTFNQEKLEGLVKEIVINAYLPYLRVCLYIPSDKGVYFATHAPVGLECLQKWRAFYPEKNFQEILLDKISFQKLHDYVQSVNKIFFEQQDKLLDVNHLEENFFQKNKINFDFPIMYVAWYRPFKEHRDLQQLIRPLTSPWSEENKNLTNMFYVHGHYSSSSSKENFEDVDKHTVNLDNSFGKSDTLCGTYAIYHLVFK
jgi:hypothetical protein